MTPQGWPDGAALPEVKVGDRVRVIEAGASATVVRVFRTRMGRTLTFLVRFDEYREDIQGTLTAYGREEIEPEKQRDAA